MTLEQKVLLALKQMLKTQGLECYEMRGSLQVTKIGHIFFDANDAAVVFTGRLVKSRIYARHYQSDKEFILACGNLLDAFITAVKTIDKAFYKLKSAEDVANLLPF